MALAGSRGASGRCSTVSYSQARKRKATTYPGNKLLNQPRFRPANAEPPGDSRACYRPDWEVVQHAKAGAYG